MGAYLQLGAGVLLAVLGAVGSFLAKGRPRVALAFGVLAVLAGSVVAIGGAMRVQEINSTRVALVDFIAEGERLRDEIRPLCDENLRLYYHQRATNLRKRAMDFLESKTPNSGLAQFVGTTTDDYSHDECGRIEWVKKYVVNLIENLRQAHARVGDYL